MKIKILGPGCPNCQKMEANTKQALEELKLEAEIKKISDISEIMSYGIMSVPALVVDKKVLVAGMVPNVEQIKELLTNLGSCNCGGDC